MANPVLSRTKPTSKLGAMGMSLTKRLKKNFDFDQTVDG